MVDVIRVFDPNVQAENLGICLECFLPNESLRRRIESDNVAVSIIDFHQALACTETRAGV